MKVVSIGAHPDDIEIGTGGALAKHHQKGDQVQVILCTLGGVVGEPEGRRLEAELASKVLGVNKIHYLDYPVSKLNKPSRGFELVIKGLLGEIMPDRLYVHSPQDFHQVHVAVSKSVCSAANGVPQVLFYETISSTTANFRPNAFVDITNYIEPKLNSICAHKSQSSRFYLQPNVITSLANTRYVWGKVGSDPKGLAEAFEIYRYMF